MEENNVILETIEEVEAVAEEVKGIDWKTIGRNTLPTLAFCAGVYATYKGIKFLVKKGKAKKEAKVASDTTKAESEYITLGDTIEADFDSEELIETEIVEEQC